MNLKETNTTEFKRAYQNLKEKSDMKFSIEMYHHDFSGEPTISAESGVEKVLLDYVDEYGLVITIMTSDINYSFSEKNWLAHVDEDYITFGSANGKGTHCSIVFC